jgi:hypothetical protein
MESNKTACFGIVYDTPKYENQNAPDLFMGNRTAKGVEQEEPKLTNIVPKTMKLLINLKII